MLHAEAAPHGGQRSASCSRTLCELYSFSFIFQSLSLIHEGAICSFSFFFPYSGILDNPTLKTGELMEVNPTPCMNHETAECRNESPAAPQHLFFIVFSISSLVAMDVSILDVSVLKIESGLLRERLKRLKNTR